VNQNPSNQWIETDAADRASHYGSDDVKEIQGFISRVRSMLKRSA
jgi:hypothetical protein